ncbi:LOW QUALITY PROTEIN: retinol dehydrogenase 16-like [Notamacropus eugenii]|uniref:LOW QUALITY PROTEIN: retinol dehydrogenase 16-like n=1 Tax=Notamacropus eugenii TaxID=9315 RepID=UPI003B6850F9
MDNSYQKVLQGLPEQDLLQDHRISLTGKSFQKVSSFFFQNKEDTAAVWFFLVVLICLYYAFCWHREKKVVQNLTEKYVFITGCDSGFGNLLAKHLDRQGLLVLASCLTEKGAEELKRNTSDRLETVILDVTKTESITAATQWVKELVQDKGLWVLVNNAGIALPTLPNEWLKKEDFVKILDVNLVGLIEVTLSMLPMVRKAQGRVINVSSVAGRVAAFGGGYCISKHGVEAFSDSLRREIAPFGVKVVIIEPEYFRTLILSPDNVNDLLKELWSQVPLEIKEAYGEHYFKSYCKFVNNFLSRGKKNLHPVIWSMENALTAVYPRTRYAVAWEAKFIQIPLSYLPASLMDFIIFKSLYRCKPAHAVC